MSGLFEHGGDLFDETPVEDRKDSALSNSEGSVTTSSITNETAAPVAISEASETASKIVIESHPLPSPEHDFVLLRLPKAFGFNEKSFGSAHDDNWDAVDSSDFSIQWRWVDADTKREIETDAYLTQWSDGSYTLTIGGRQLECQTIREKSQIFECTQPTLQVQHMNIVKKMVCRPLDRTLLRNPLQRPRPPNTEVFTQGAKGTRLTTPRDTASHEVLGSRTQQVDDRRGSRGAAVHRHYSGLSASFLEAL